MKKAILLPLCLIFIVPCLMAPGQTAGRSDAVSAQESDRVLKATFEKGIEIYKKYRGIESLRKELIKEYDPETGELRSTSEVTTRRKEFYYAMPEIEVLAYKKDGKEMDPAKYRVWKAMPLYPIFDIRGRERYTIRITGRKKVAGKECYCLQVEPKQETSRHFRGTVYLAVKTLESVSLEGTMAKLDFPMKEFLIELNMTLVDTVPVAKTGTARIRVKVPIFYPDTIIESSINVLESRLMQ